MGSDADGEYIRLSNPNPDPIVLDGWIIRDNKGREHRISEMSIGGHGQLMLPYDMTRIPLSNSGALLELVDPSDTIQDVVSYSGPAREGMRYLRAPDGLWYWEGESGPETAPAAEGGGGDGVEDDGGHSVTGTVGQEVLSEISEEESESTVETGNTTGLAPLISELLPNPDGPDTEEWIELANPYEVTLSLDGWSVDDAAGGSAPYVFPAGTSMGASSFLLLTRQVSKIYLNNDADEVRLVSPDGSIMETASYADAPSGQAWVRVGDRWSWSDAPTPGSLNDPGTPSDPDGDPTSESLTAVTDLSDAAPDVMTVEISSLSSLENGAAVAIAGVVSLPFGAAGKTLFGLQDTAGVDGLFVRVFDDELPQLTVGDAVSVRGKINRSDGILRLHVSDAEDIVAGDAPLPLIFAPRDIGDLAPADDGTAVEISGLPGDRSESWLDLTDETADHEIKTVLVNGMPLGPIPSGAAVTVRGVFRHRTGGSEILVGSRENMTITERNIENGAPAGNVPMIISQTDASSGHPLVSGLGISAGLTGLLLWLAKRRGLLGLALGR
ncbi:hypothetical protein AMJ57_03910 [Parcubacteria bacterium SG8_24]|nr:MAG: hypothetical protein AMJ57_03910 [Parcubacteria bacterium SG8_24]